jgi:predicted nuclease with TOPRIM domain
MTTVNDLRKTVKLIQQENGQIRQTVKDNLARINIIQDQIKKARQEAKEALQKSKAEKAKARKEKREAKIKELQARIKKLQEPKIGIAAKKASRKPGPVTVTVRAGIGATAEV